jgi:hypothetical protein
MPANTIVATEMPIDESVRSVIFPFGRKEDEEKEGRKEGRCQRTKREENEGR